ncbi:hypothetical protein MMPV_006846 [Pyropia vietnamensis]
MAPPTAAALRPPPAAFVLAATAISTATTAIARLGRGRVALGYRPPPRSPRGAGVRLPPPTLPVRVGAAAITQGGSWLPGRRSSPSPRRWSRRLRRSAAAAGITATVRPGGDDGGKGNGDGNGNGDGVGLLERLRAKAAATYEALDSGQQAYVQALYIAIVVSAFVSVSATMVRLYRAWGLPPFG